MAVVLLTITEAAERLNVKPRFIRELIDTRAIEVQKLGDKRRSLVRIREDALERWLDQHVRPAREAS